MWYGVSERRDHRLDRAAVPVTASTSASTSRAAWCWSSSSRRPRISRRRAAIAGSGSFTHAAVQNFGDDNAERHGAAAAAGGRGRQRSQQDVLDALKTGGPERRAAADGSRRSAGRRGAANQGGLAILFTFILIGIYTWFRFQWKMGISAIIATLHDPLIILGFFADTQITFDLPGSPRSSRSSATRSTTPSWCSTGCARTSTRRRRTSSEEVMDASINQTLSRTIITSGATLLVVVVLLIMGGEALRGFSWALTIGIIVGTYSSIYVAGALALDMKLSARDLMRTEGRRSKVDAMP